MNKNKQMNRVTHLLWRGEIPVEIHHKQIRHSYLRLKTDPARLVCSLPARVTLADAEVFLEKHEEWIRQRWQKMQLAMPSILNEGSENRVRLWGCGLPVIVLHDPTYRKAKLVQKEDILLLQSPASLSPEQRANLLIEFYRQEMKKVLPVLIETEASRMQVQVSQWGVKHMKTRWGSCNPKAGRIWLNLELAKREAYLLRYVVIHELAHLIVPNHGARFKKVMDLYCPAWRDLRKELRNS